MCSLSREEKLEFLEDIPLAILDLDKLNIYLKAGFLGWGTFSVCFKVVQYETRELFACKASKFKVDANKLTVAREVRIHQSLDHENIVKFHEYFIEKDAGYLIMELCDGNMTKILARRLPLKSKLSLDLQQQITSAVIYLHYYCHIVHRDLKPQNILMKGNTIKISDFGLALEMTDPFVKFEVGPNVSGTREYMAPEVATGNFYGIQCDCWAVGCIFHKMFKRSVPFLFAELQKGIAKSYKVPKKATKAQKEILQGLFEIDPEKRWSMIHVFERLSMKEPKKKHRYWLF